LNITVEDASKTKLYDTTVEILKGDDVIASELAQRVHTMRSGEFAMAQFSLEPGFYFIRLKRSSYPEHIVPVSLEQNMQKQLVMILKKATYTLYGQIIDNPTDKWKASKTYIIDEKDALYAQSTIQKDGYYSVDNLDPAKTYRLRIGEGDDKKISSPFKYEGEGAYYLEIDLTKQDPVLSDTAPKMTSAQSTKLGQLINVYLKYGEKSAPDEQVLVRTPKGTITIISDEDGIARIGGADWGEYTFEWKGQTVITTITAPVQEQIDEEPQAEQTPVVQNNQPQKQEQPPNNTLMLGIGFSLFVGAMIGIVVVAIIAYYLYNNKKKTSK
jgi:hypothetical protein